MLCLESKDTEFMSRNQLIDVKICQVVEGGGRGGITTNKLRSISK